jgi:ketosteroid isomerase-like protein
MSADDNKRTVFHILKHRSCPETYADLLADDCVALTVADPATFPPAARSRTKAEHLNGLRKARDLYINDEGQPGMTFTPLGITAEGDRVAVELVASARLKGDRTRQLRNRMHILFEFQGDKVARIKGYEDTGYVVARWSDVSEQIRPENVQTAQQIRGSSSDII